MSSPEPDAPPTEGEATPTPETAPEPAPAQTPTPAPVLAPAPEVTLAEVQHKLKEAEARLQSSEAKQKESLTKLQDAETRLREISKAFREQREEMDSFRQRMTQNADQRLERRSAEIIEQFFEPVRNLRRSLEASGADPAAVIAGLGMIRQQFDDTLTRLGLQEIPGVGSAFDPNLHEALMIQPVADPAQDGRVVTVYAAGYRLGNKVLQPAQVVVGKLVEGEA